MRKRRDGLTATALLGSFAGVTFYIVRLWPEQFMAGNGPPALYVFWHQIPAQLASVAAGFVLCELVRQITKRLHHRHWGPYPVTKIVGTLTLMAILAPILSPMLGGTPASDDALPIMNMPLILAIAIVNGVLFWLFGVKHKTSA